MRAKAVVRRGIDPALVGPMVASGPLCFLDFETFASGIPLFDGTRPYQQVPFQYSLHRIDAEGDRVGTVAVERDCPCGAARFVASVLPGTRLAEAADTGALRHHHHPCMASMEIDPDRNDTLMHLSGYIFRAAIQAALKGK